MVLAAPSARYGSEVRATDQARPIGSGAGQRGRASAAVGDRGRRARGSARVDSGATRQSSGGAVATGASHAGSGVVANGSSYDRIYAVVRKIPRGRVTTYGTVARLAGLDGQPRLVGYALSALRDGTGVPWHRVINAQGRLSLERAASRAGLTQLMRLAREGVRADAAGRISLTKFGWRVQATRPDRRIPRTAERPLPRTKPGG